MAIIISYLTGASAIIVFFEKQPLNIQNETKIKMPKNLPRELTLFVEYNIFKGNTREQTTIRELFRLAGFH